MKKGYYGDFGGQFVPELLMPPLLELEEAMRTIVPSEAFQNELTQYKLSRGTVQFPLDKPLPMELIQRIVKYRLAENLAK